MFSARYSSRKACTSQKMNGPDPKLRASRPRSKGQVKATRSKTVQFRRFSPLIGIMRRKYPETIGKEGETAFGN